MRPRSSAFLVAALVLVLFAAAFAPATAGQDEWNEQVCPVCGPEFETAATLNDVDVTVAESTAVVEVERDGTAHWTVRNRLSNGSQARRLADADLRPALRNRLDAHLKLDAEQVRNVSTRVDGDTVVVTFTDTDAGTRAFGRTVVTHFWLDQGIEGGPFYRFEADRVTVVGPRGTQVVNSPDRDGERVDDARVGDGPDDGGASAEDGRWVVWSNATADYPPPNVNSLVVFGSHTGPGSALQTDLAVLSVRTEGHLVPALVRFVPLALVPGVLVLGGVVALTRALSLRERWSTRRRVGSALAVLALAPLAAFTWSLCAGLDGLLLGLWLASVVATFALGAARSRPERLAAGTVAGVAFCAALVLLGLRIGAFGIIFVPVVALGAALGAAALYPVGAAFAPGSGSLDGQR